MSKKCGNCGSPAPDDNSVFCNRCGARLPAAGPAPVLTCRECGNPVVDRQARFCDRCGSPLLPPVSAFAPPGPMAKKGKVCPGCGFENFGENLFYCKKCGAVFPKYETIPERRPAEKNPARRPHDGPIRIIPDGMDELRQRPVNPLVVARQTPMEEPVALRRPIAKPPGKAPELPRKALPEAPQLNVFGHSRRIAPVAAGIVLLVIVIAVIAVSIPGLFRGGSDNATAPESAGSNAADPGLLGALPWGIFQNKTPVVNQATPVVTDTSLTPSLD